MVILFISVQSLFGFCLGPRETANHAHACTHIYVTVTEVTKPRPRKVFTCPLESWDSSLVSSAAQPHSAACGPTGVQGTNSSKSLCYTMQANQHSTDLELVSIHCPRAAVGTLIQALPS